MNNSEQIQKMAAAAKNRELSLLEAIILSIRLCAEQMICGGAAHGGAIGPQAQQIRNYLEILMIARIGPLEQEVVKKFLPEVPEFFRLARREIPDNIGEAFKVFGFEWTEPVPVEPIVRTASAGSTIKLVKVVGRNATVTVVPLESVINRAFPIPGG